MPILRGDQPAAGADCAGAGRTAGGVAAKYPRPICCTSSGRSPRTPLAFVQQEWAGTASELLDVLGPTVKITNSKVFSDELARLAPMLRTVGIDIRHQRKADRRQITIVRRQ